MLYRLGSEITYEGANFDTLIVKDADEQTAAHAEGWCVTTTGAKGKKPKVEKAIEADDTPPTRDELEQKAKQLGIKFDGRTSSKTLTAQIAEALKA